MDWAALKNGFEDELLKIGEISLAGLKAETLLNYPEPQIPPSPGYEKAKAILQKAQQYQELSPEEEKVAHIGMPDELPKIQVLMRRRKKRGDEPPPGKIEKAKSLGAHTLAGAGAGKFLHSAVESAVQAKKNRWDVYLPTRSRFGAVAAGAGLGAAEWARKEHRKKKWQQGQAKTSGAKPFSFPSTGHASSQFLGKSGPSIKQQAPRIGLKGVLPKI